MSFKWLQRKMVPTYASGDIVKDRYKILSKVVSTALHETFIAEDLRLPNGKPVVLKFIRYSSLRTWSGRQEAKRAIRNIGCSPIHTGNFQLYANVTKASHRYCIVSRPYVEGETLRELLNRCGQLSVSDTLHILWEIVTLLGGPQLNSIIHGNIKPENVILEDSEGEPTKKVHLTDHLLALETKSELHTRISEKRMDYRSWWWLQITGESYLKRSHIRSQEDIFSLGALAFEMLTGRNASYEDSLFVHQGRSPNAYGPPLFPSRYAVLSPALEGIINRCVQADPKERFQSIASLSKALLWEMENGDAGIDRIKECRSVYCPSRLN